MESVGFRPKQSIKVLFLLQKDEATPAQWQDRVSIERPNAIRTPSSQVTLPAYDKALPSATTGIFRPEHRWFDFSGASIPFDEYEDLHSDPEVCPPLVSLSSSAFFHRGTFRVVPLAL